MVSRRVGLHAVLEPPDPAQSVARFLVLNDWETACGKPSPATCRAEAFSAWTSPISRPAAPDLVSEHLSCSRNDTEPTPFPGALRPNQPEALSQHSTPAPTLLAPPLHTQPLAQAVGTAGTLFTPIPLLMKQGYMIWVGVVMAYIFTWVPDWTSWVLMLAMALYDIAAVLMPGGPLKVSKGWAEGRDRGVAGC